MGIWNYELMPGTANPEPKFYIDLNGEPDHQKLAGITSFFEHLGWTETAKYYPSTLQSYLYVDSHYYCIGKSGTNIRAARKPIYKKPQT